jgi:hypothetical protein
MTLDQLLVIGAGVLWVVTVHCAHSSGLRQDRDQGFAEGHKEGLTQGRLEGYRPSIPPMTE